MVTHRHFVMVGPKVFWHRSGLIPVVLGTALWYQRPHWMNPSEPPTKVVRAPGYKPTPRKRSARVKRFEIDSE